MARTSGPLGCSTLLNHETSHQAQLRARIHPNSTFSFHCKVCSPENRNAVQSFPAKRGQATRKGTQSLETSARRESLAQNCSTEKFFLLCSGGLEPAFRVLFSAIFHGFPRESPSAWKTVEGSGNKNAAHCCKSAYIFYFSYIIKCTRPTLRVGRRPFSRRRYLESFESQLCKIQIKAL